MIAFNSWYYSFSPHSANYLSNHEVERTMMKGALYPLIGILGLSSELFYAFQAYPELAAVLSGLLASSLIGAFYVGLPLTVLRLKINPLRKRKTGASLEKLLASALLLGISGLVIGELLISGTLLMLSSALTVLSALFMSALVTSAALAKHFRQMRLTD